MTPTTFRVLDWIADAIDPLLALVALAAPWLRRPRGLHPILVYYLGAGTAIAMVYVVRAVDMRYQIWAAGGLDYSTHTAFATSLLTSLVAFHRRWLAPALTVFTLYISLLLVLRYHGFLDVLTSSLLAAGVTALLHYASSVRELINHGRP